jgi:uncharacterized protein (TIGR03382 family)
MGKVILLENTHGNQICPGDSGGPTLYEIGGREAVVGVSSFILGACEDTSTLGFSVRTDSYLDFITDSIAERGGDPPVVLLDSNRGAEDSGGCASAANTGAPAALLLALFALGLPRRREQS